MSGPNEVEVDVPPEPFTGLTISVMTPTEVVGEDALCRQPNLEFLSWTATRWTPAGIRRCLVSWCVVIGGLFVALGGAIDRRWGEWHAQVGAQHVNDGLPLIVVVVMCDAFEGVQAAETDSGVRVAELLDGLREQLGGSPMRGVFLSGRLGVFGVALSAYGKEQCSSSAAGCDRSEAVLDRLDA
jgi:hypothetical protein